eukprot:1155916-Pelagomonas_calceolata.AAC.15
MYLSMASSLRRLPVMTVPLGTLSRAMATSPESAAKATHAAVPLGSQREVYGKRDLERQTFII